MNPPVSLAISFFAATLLQGCVAGVVTDVVTAPVRVASGAVDLATTSQSEADENRGREIRKREEQLGKLERSYTKHRRQCEDGDPDACAKAREEYAAIQQILPTIPTE